jgi:SPP1 family predicted phage head-tail adaptor
MKRTPIGAMDQRITLQRIVRTADGAGGITEGWADFADCPTIWANVIAKAGNESMIEGRMTATFTVLFTIHNRRDIEPRDRIIWQGVAYNIRGIRDMGGRELRLVIEAERGVAQ